MFFFLHGGWLSDECRKRLGVELWSVFFWKAMNSSISEISPLLGGFSNTSVAFSP